MNNTKLKSEKKIKKVYKCDLCNSTFKEKIKLYIHRNRRNSHKFTCVYCPMAFVFRKKLRLHLQNNHDFAYRSSTPNFTKNHSTVTVDSSRFRYKCRYCANKYFNRSERMRHERMHTGEKPYICDMCPKRFSQESNLQRHRNVHLGVKPFSCKKCFQSFTDKSSLNRHLCSYPSTIFESNVKFYNSQYSPEKMFPMQFKQPINNYYQPETEIQNGQGFDTSNTCSFPNFDFEVEETKKSSAEEEFDGKLNKNFSSELIDYLY